MKSSQGDLKPKNKKFLKVLVVVILAIVMVISTMTIVYNKNDDKLIAVGDTVIPTGVNTTLNITFSGVTYSTEPPALEYSRGDYNTHAIWSGSSNNIGNYTYLIFNTTSSLTTPVGVQYNLTSFVNRSYYFQESKIAFNGTSNISMVISPKMVSTTSQVTSTSGLVDGDILITIDSGSMSVYYVVANATGVATAYAIGSAYTLTALQFYDISVYVYGTSAGDYITVGLINPTNGLIINKFATSSAISDINYKDLNYSAYQFTGSSSAGDSALILDWGYNVFNGSSALATSDAMPFLASGLSNVIAPFDPSALANTSYKQAPNATYIHTNTKVGASDFNLSSSSLSNSTQSILSSGVNTTYAKWGVGNNTTATSYNMVSNLSINAENTTAITADIHIATFTANGINTAIINFLRNYTAVKASVATGISYSYKNMTIISYMISNIQVDQELSSADASAVRNAFDNEFPAIMAKDNLSLVDTNTSAIVAGAFAGFFYYQGMAVAPEILANNVIENPINDQTFANLSDAGFASGAYISGGSIIVPQLTFEGFDAGTPIFASGFSFGSIFGGLTSAGSAVEHYLSAGSSVISHAISSGVSKASSTANNYVVKPITTATTDTAKNVSKDINNFKSQISTVSNNIMPELGVVQGNLQKDISGALGPISGAVKDLSSSLSSAQNAMVTAVASGANGLKTDIYSIGTDVKNSTQGIINTLDNKIADTDAVLSSMFTAIKTLPSQINSGITSVLEYTHNATMSALDTIGSSIDKSGSVVENSFGNLAHDIVSPFGSVEKGLKGAFSAISAFGAKLGFVLEIVGMTIAVIVIVGIVLYILFVWKPKNMIPGETRI